MDIHPRVGIGDMLPREGGTGGWRLVQPWFLPQTGQSGLPVICSSWKRMVW